MERAYIARNDASRQRLRELLDRLTDDDLQREVAGWTVAVTLLHLAFWDHLTVRRWQRTIADGGGLPLSFGQPFLDLVNDSAIDTWAGIPPAAARDAVLTAADDCDRYVADLPETIVAAALAGGMERTLDRATHRATHLDPLEAAFER